MHYYLYEIKNVLNGKIYIGVHKTKSLDDGYMGSGTVIKNAIEKYGITNFTKTIIETFDNIEMMYEREKIIVNDEFLLRDDVYNVRRGGLGGFDYMNSNPDIIQKRLNSIRGNPAIGVKNSVFGKVWITDDIHSTMICDTDNIPFGWKFGRTISDRQKSHLKSSRTGTVRITDDIKNKYMKQTEVLPEGWRYGWCKN